MNVIVDNVGLGAVTGSMPGGRVYRGEIGPGSVGVASQSEQIVIEEAGPPPIVVITAVWQGMELQLWVVVVVPPVRSQPVLVAVQVAEQLSDPLTVEHVSKQNVAV
jgi:hypothetical protein